MLEHLNILNPNSSGQGYCIAHADTLYHPILCDKGWTYSHTTLITGRSGIKYGHHTYKFGDWNFGISIGSSGCKLYCSRSASSWMSIILPHEFDTYLSRKTTRIIKEMQCNSVTTKVTLLTSPARD